MNVDQPIWLNNEALAVTEDDSSQVSTVMWLGNEAVVLWRYAEAAVVETEADVIFFSMNF
ncbi:hypothetical protein KDA08_05650 [Candidatus Saccharibacteria bacterium]|nr:hypothetical protein [Candidatus Saccharibacteria bacterium]